MESPISEMPCPAVTRRRSRALFLVIVVARTIYLAESLITFESVRARSYPAWYMKTRRNAYLPAVVFVTVNLVDVAPVMALHLVRCAVGQLYH